MMSYLPLMGLLAGVACSLLIPVLVCFHRRLVFARWAKASSIVAGAAGLGWGFLGYKLRAAYGAELNYDFYAAYNIKGLLGGLCIGLVFSLLISRPYAKRTLDTNL